MRFNQGINPEYTERDAKANEESTAKYAKYAKKMRMQKKSEDETSPNSEPPPAFPRRGARA